MLAAFLSLSIASCSSDDDDDNSGSGNGGKMSGWVEIDGKKYSFSYFYGAKNSDKTEISFNGFNVDPYKMNQNTIYNMTSFSLLFVPDGSKLDMDEGSLGISFEFELNCDNNGNDNMVMYADHNTSSNGVTASRSGEKITVDGKNVEVRYSKPGVGCVGMDDPKTTVNFHFEGTPKWIDFD